MNHAVGIGKYPFVPLRPPCHPAVWKAPLNESETGYEKVWIFTNYIFLRMVTLSVSVHCCLFISFRGTYERFWKLEKGVMSNNK